MNEPTQALPYAEPGVRQLWSSPVGKEKPASAACSKVPPARGWAARRFTLSVTHTSNRVTRPRRPHHSNGVILAQALRPGGSGSRRERSRRPDRLATPGSNEPAAAATCHFTPAHAKRFPPDVPVRVSDGERREHWTIRVTYAQSLMEAVPDVDYWKRSDRWAAHSHRGSGSRTTCGYPAEARVIAPTYRDGHPRSGNWIPSQSMPFATSAGSATARSRTILRLDSRRTDQLWLKQIRNRSAA